MPRTKHRAARKSAPITPPLMDLVQATALAQAAEQAARAGNWDVVHDLLRQPEGGEGFNPRQATPLLNPLLCLALGAGKTNIAERLLDWRVSVKNALGSVRDKEFFKLLMDNVWESEMADMVPADNPALKVLLGAWKEAYYQTEEEEEEHSH